jgi:hypothetical protein
MLVVSSSSHGARARGGADHCDHRPVEDLARHSRRAALRPVFERHPEVATEIAEVLEALEGP